MRPRDLQGGLGNQSAKYNGQKQLGQVAFGNPNLNAQTLRQNIQVMNSCYYSLHSCGDFVRVCTRSIAIFCACLALSTPLEIVIFSPARRASRKLLERIVEFLRLLDMEQSILEFNQEQCRLRSANGKNSLIRSFPSKVSVRKSPSNSPHPHHTTRMQHQAAAITRICPARRRPRRWEQRRSTGARSPASPPAARPTGR